MRRYAVVLAAALLFAIVGVSVAFAATGLGGTASAAPPGLSEADWADIGSQLPAGVVAATDFAGATQQAYLKASNTGSGDYFGCSVAVSGDTVVVGAYTESSNSSGVNGNQADNSATHAGAAYIFVRSGTNWTQQAYLKSPNPDVADYFGFSVAIAGDTVVIGTIGEDGSASGINGTHDNSMSDAGAAYIFVRSGTTWSQQAYLKASNPGSGDYFGYSVAISGDSVVVGANWEDSNASGVGGDQTNNGATSAGAAYVFSRSGTTWTQQAYLKAANPGVNDFFGTAVGLSGDTVVVGATEEDGSATGANGSYDNAESNSGAVYVFTRSASVWSQQAYLKASNTGAGDLFGSSVGISGDTVVVGAPNEDSSAVGIDGDQNDNARDTSGAAYIFSRSAATWSQQAYVKASNAGGGDQFGIYAAADGDTVVVGAAMEDGNASGVGGDQSNNSSSDAGAAYVFGRNGATWGQQAYVKSSNPDSNDWFGLSVAVSGDTLVVSGFGEDSSSTGVNGNQADNSASMAGAAYVFVGVPGSAATTLTYTGSTMDADGGPGTVLSAKLACPDDPDLAVGQSIEFYVMQGAIAGMDGQGGEHVGSAVTGADGVASITWSHDPAFTGEVKVIAEFLGTEGLEESAVSTKILLVTPSWDSVRGSVSGSGEYSPNEAGTAAFRLSVTSKGSAYGPTRGNLSWNFGNGPRYELTGITIMSFAPTRYGDYAKACYVRGMGRLATFPTWGRFARPSSVVMVSFVALVCDGGTTKVGTKKVNLPDAIGLDILGVEIPGESWPFQLSSGNLVIQ
jgi:hypothetical protein